MEEVLVTRKGQITVPIHLRRKYGIKEGMKIAIEDSGTKITLRVVPKFQDLIGTDAETQDLEVTLKKIDSMRSEDRY